MPILEWNDALDIGVTDMNQEHKKLLALMNELYDKNASGATKASLSKTLNELAAYTTQHFADEEAYLEKIGYPELSKHKWIHHEVR
jgi:hemerythrin